MSKYDWQRFLRFARRVHNIQVQKAQSELRKAKSKSRIPTYLNELKIKKTDTAQLTINKLAFFWFTFGNINQKIDAVAVVPEWWAMRTGSDRPQLIITFGELKPDGKKGKPEYSISIPHYNGPPKLTHSPIPNYQKGQKQGILTLGDNSKVIVNAVNEDEAERVLNAARKIINPKYLKNSHIKIGDRKGQKLKQVKVGAVAAKFFRHGQANATNPDWKSYFF